MPSPNPAAQVLDREFLETRSKLLELAACFDRLDRPAGNIAGDPRIQQLHEALGVIQRERGNRAEQVLMVFSRTYDENWRAAWDLPRPHDR